MVDAVGTGASALLLTAVLASLLHGPWPAKLVVALAGLLIPVPASISVLRRRPRRTSAADRVTLLRGVLAGGCASLVALSLLGDLPLRSWPLFWLALPAFLLDGVDGWLARRTGTSSKAGGRLDMETDAAFFLVLSIPLSLAVGPWVLGIGMLRYVFLAASWLRPALSGPLAFSSFRRTAAGVQGGVLVAVCSPMVPDTVAAVATATALGVLAVSFGLDVATLERARTGAAPVERPSETSGHAQQ